MTDNQWQLMGEQDPFDIQAPEGKEYRWARKTLMGDASFDETPFLLRGGWSYVDARDIATEQDGLVLMQCDSSVYETKRDAAYADARRPVQYMMAVLSPAWRPCPVSEGPIVAPRPEHPCLSSEALNRRASVPIRDALAMPVYVGEYRVPHRFVAALRWLRLQWYGLNEREYKMSIDGTIVWNTCWDYRNNTAIGPAEYSRRKRLMRRKGIYGVA